MTNTCSSLIKFCWIMSGILVYSISPVHADPYLNTFSSQNICYAIQFAVHHLSPDSSSTNWPQKLEVSDMSFPVWKNADQTQAISLIEENYINKIVADREFDIRFQVGGSSVEPYKQSELDNIANKWLKLLMPVYKEAQSNHFLEFETAAISLNFNKDTRLTLFRYRLKPVGDPKLGMSYQLLDADHNWQYIVRIHNGASSFNDFPISRGLSPIAGQIAVLQSSLVFFATNSSVGPDLLEVYLPPAPSWWSYGGVAVSDACQLTFSR